MARNSDFDWVIEPWLVQPRGFRGSHSDEAEQARQEAIEHLEDMIRAGMMMSLQMRDDPSLSGYVEAFASHRALLEVVANSQLGTLRNSASLRISRPSPWNSPLTGDRRTRGHSVSTRQVGEECQPSSSCTGLPKRPWENSNFMLLTRQPARKPLRLRSGNSTFRAMRT
jgi:hypothetical protein